MIEQNDKLQQKNNAKKIVFWSIIGVLVCGIIAWCIVNLVKVPSNAEIAVKNKTYGFSAVVALLFGMFLVASLGYLLGSINIKGVSLGTAGVFLVAIAFGCLSTMKWLNSTPILNNLYIKDSSATLYKYYSSIVQNIGLVLFVGAVGFIAGPNFFKNLKKNAKSYVLLGVIIIVIGAIIAVIFALILGQANHGKELSAGILSGALTTTPGYSAALEAADDAGDAFVTLGHAIAYPFGVVGVVLFVQLMPKFLKADMEKERGLLKIEGAEMISKKEGLFMADPFGLMAFGLAVIAGLLFGAIKIPLTGKGYQGTCFSLGTTGGVLIMCLVFGHFGHFGKLSLEVPEHTAKVLRELGLMLFLIGAGVAGGAELVAKISNKEVTGGIIAIGFGAGIIMTIAPMVVGYFFATKVLRIPLLNTLGSITGGMTSTPALGTLVKVAETDDVASAYASTYPIALVLIVLASQFIVTLL
ncbi:MAG: permease [Clostridia bacterium]|nr:permease [Clostridia bacterium]